MRVLILNNIFPPGFIGGYELGALDVARGLVSRGHTVEVLTSDALVDDQRELEFRVDRVLRCGSLSRFPSERESLAPFQDFIIPANIRHLVSTLIRFRPDRVLCFNIALIGPVGFLQYLTATGYRPVLYLMDDVFAGYGKNLNNRSAYEQTFGPPLWLDRLECIFMSRNVRAQVEVSVGRNAPNATIIPGWFDRAIATSTASASKSRSAERPVKFIFASRLAGHKGIDIVLEASRAVLEYGFTCFSVDLVGNGDVAQTLHRIHALDLRQHVSYLGELKKADLLSRYADYDALLFPTWPREPFGFVVGEAAAAGCLPVMTAQIGASEWFLDGIDSLKTSNTVSSLSAAMMRLIAMPAIERNAMRGRAQATARRFFGFDRALASVESALLKGEDRPPPTVAAPKELRAVEASLEVLTDVWRLGAHG